MTYVLAVIFPFVGLLFAGRFFYAIIFFALEIVAVSFMWPLHFVLILCAWVLIDSRKKKNENDKLREQVNAGDELMKRIKDITDENRKSVESMSAVLSSIKNDLKNRQ